MQTELTLQDVLQAANSLSVCCSVCCSAPACVAVVLCGSPSGWPAHKCMSAVCYGFTRSIAYRHVGTLQHTIGNTCNRHSGKAQQTRKQCNNSTETVQQLYAAPSGLAMVVYVVVALTRHLLIIFTAAPAECESAVASSM